LLAKIIRGNLFYFRKQLYLVESKNENVVMAQKTRNKQIPSEEMMEFILLYLKSKDGLQIKSKEICNEIQKAFGLQKPPSESMVRGVVHKLRMEHGHWQLNASNRGYSFDDSDTKYQAWKNMFQSQITSMIRCLHKMETCYVCDLNIYLVSRGGDPTAKPIFTFLPNDLEFGEIVQRNLLHEPIWEPDNELRNMVKAANSKKKKKKKDDKRGEFFRYVKSIRKENESWKEAIARAKQTRNPQEVEAQVKGGLWSRLSKNLSLTRDA
jgi:hypothetical protein